MTIDELVGKKLKYRNDLFKIDGSAYRGYCIRDLQGRMILTISKVNKNSFHYSSIPIFGTRTTIGTIFLEEITIINQ